MDGGLDSGSGRPPSPEASLGEIQIHLRRNLPSHADLVDLNETHINFVRHQLARHPITQPWQDRPRTFTLLWILGWICGDLQITAKAQPFLEDPAGDFLIPFNQQLFPLRGEPGWEEDWQLFSNVQPCVLSHLSTLDGAAPRGAPTHRHFHDLKVMLEEVDLLGSRYRTQVHKVQHQNGNFYVKKSIWRSETPSDQRPQYEEFDRERRAMLELNHWHLVKCIGTYTDKKQFSLLMMPVCDSDLDAVLNATQEDPILQKDNQWLRQSFGCLATALHYLHMVAGVRHRDIKPSNILVHEGSIFLCDFGIATLFSGDAATTEGPVPACTRRYSAPEVIDERARNEYADVWSLGCVFLEIVTVIKGRTLHEMDVFLDKMEAKRDYWAFTEQVHDWIKSLVDGTQDDAPLDWVKMMIHPEAEKRPSSGAILQKIKSWTGPDNDTINPFIGDCCLTPTAPSTPSGRWTSPESTSSRIPSRDPTTPIRSNRTSLLWEPIQHNLNQRSALRAAQLHEHLQSHVNALKLQPAVPESVESVAPETPLPPPRQTRNNSDSMMTMLSAVTPHSHFASRLSRPFPRPSTESGDYLTIAPTRTSSLASSNQSSAESLVFSCLLQSYEILEGGEAFRRDLGVSTNQTTIRLYQEHKERPDQTTRRLVIELPSNAEVSTQLSTWLPLAEIHISRDDEEVNVKWSDCNHLRTEKPGDYSEICHRVWERHLPNNHVLLKFPERTDADSFVDAIRLLHEDGHVSKQGQPINPPGSIEIHLYELGSRGTKKYRAMLLTSRDEQFDTSIYLVPSVLGFQLQYLPHLGKYDFIVQGLKAPVYWSNVHEIPIPDEVGYYAWTKWKTESLNFDFTDVKPQHGLIWPTARLSSLLENMTGATSGWTLIACATGVTIKQRQRGKGFPHRWHELSKGNGELMIWKRLRVNNLVIKLSFRLPSDKSDKESPYLTGTVPVNDEINSSPGKTEINLDGTKRGPLLDVENMRGSPEKPEKSDLSSGKPYTYRLEFSIGNDHHDFEAIIRELAQERRARATGSLDFRASGSLRRPTYGHTSPSPDGTPPAVRINM